MRLMTLVGAFLSIVGCTAVPAADPEPRIVRVEIPVPVPCLIGDVPEPVWAADVVAKTDPLEVKVRALLAERFQRVGYIRELRGAIDSCR